MMGRRFKRLVGLCGVVALAGCVSYEPLPLDKTPNLASSATALEGAGNSPITLAVLDRLVPRNNPDLIAARAKLGIGAAQILQAGILPNPQMTVSYPFYVAGPDGGDGFSLGLAQDLKSILLRPSKRAVAENAAAEINASLLWQEWQTIGKARLLFVDILSGERLKAIVLRNRKVLKERFDRTNAAIAQGNAALATLSPDLVASGDAQKSLDDLDRLQLGRRHQLAALLGLTPDAPLPLAAGRDLPRLDVGRVSRDLATLADRRPDLVALQYAYRSEDAKLRQAILSQFPNLIVGVAGGRDTSFVSSLGPQATFDLPVFDRNEGGIALERASREALNLEFNARVTAATGEVRALLSEQALLSRQIAALEPRLAEARLIADQTEAAVKQGAFDERAYVDIEVAVLAREQEKIALRQALLDGQVALATLVGAGMPRVTLDADRPPDDPLGLLRAVSR